MHCLLPFQLELVNNVLHDYSLMVKQLQKYPKNNFPSCRSYSYSLNCLFQPIFVKFNKTKIDKELKSLYFAAIPLLCLAKMHSIVFNLEPKLGY